MLPQSVLEFAGAPSFFIFLVSLLLYSKWSTHTGKLVTSHFPVYVLSLTTYAFFFLSFSNYISSLGLDTKKSSAARPKWASSSGSPDPSSPQRADSPSEPVRSGSQGANNPNTGPTSRSGKAETKTTGK